jgi:ribonuclease P protein component
MKGNKRRERFTALVPGEQREKIYRKERLHKKEDFQRLVQQGRRYYSHQYTVIVVHNNLNFGRFALSIGKKVGNAAVRNYEKRLCREFFRREKQWFEKGNDILIVIKQRTVNFTDSYEQLCTLFHRFFRNSLS